MTLYLNGTTGVSGVDGSAGTPAIQGTDTNTGISFPAADTIAFNEGGAEVGRFDSSGRLLVGTSTARSNYYNTTTLSALLQVEGVSNATRIVSQIHNTADNAGPIHVLGKSRTASAGSNTVVQSGDELGVLSFQGADGSELVEAALIGCYVDGTPGANDMPGRLVFSTTADGASSPTERLRIDNAGQVFIGCTGLTNDAPNTAGGTLKQTNGNTKVRVGGDGTPAFQFYSPTGGTGSPVGSIGVNASSTSYSTSSDYRLKENVTPVSDGITRLQQLKPSRFNFKADTAKTVDGFLAHEVQTVVPEAITGEKDAVDDEGNPEYQGIDQSKLVPLLTAALQEAIGEIESLKARVVALEAQ